MSEIPPDAEGDEPVEQMQVPEPKKRVTQLFLGGKKKREPQITIDPESGKKILRKQKQKVNSGFKINKPVDW